MSTPFSKSLKNEKQPQEGEAPESAKTQKACASIAATWKEVDPDHDGWEACLGLIVPGAVVPEGTIADISELDDGSLAALVDNGDDLVRLSFDAIDLDKLPAPAKLWISAYQRNGRG